MSSIYLHPLVAYIMEEEINVISEDGHENSSFDCSDNTIVENCDADITDLKIVKAELSALKMFVQNKYI